MLTEGQGLSVYRIVRLLGEGGMGAGQHVVGIAGLAGGSSRFALATAVGRLTLTSRYRSDTAGC